MLKKTLVGWSFLSFAEQNNKIELVQPYSMKESLETYLLFQAKMVVELLDTLLENGVSPDSIG